jgi:hypothetical protein
MQRQQQLLAAPFAADLHPQTQGLRATYSDPGLPAAWGLGAAYSDPGLPPFGLLSRDIHHDPQPMAQVQAAPPMASCPAPNSGPLLLPAAQPMPAVQAHAVALPFTLQL